MFFVVQLVFLHLNSHQRMGDNNLCPEIPQREKHFTNLPLLAHLYLAVQVLIAHCYLFHSRWTKKSTTVDHHLLSCSCFCTTKDISPFCDKCQQHQHLFGFDWMIDWDVTKCDSPSMNLQCNMFWQVSVLDALKLPLGGLGKYQLV